MDEEAPERLPTVDLFGISVVMAPMDRVVGWLTARAEAGVPTRVASLNAEQVVTMRRDPALREGLASADVVVPDGQSVVWLARLLGYRPAERVAGPDLMAATMRSAEERGLPVYLLGTTDEALGSLRRVLATRFPRLAVVEARNGFFDVEDEEQVADRVARSGARFVYVGIPSTRQVVWASRWRPDRNGAVAIGVGGAFDVAAGRRRRAPRWMQRSGLEWLFRLVQEPGRLWRRYLLGNVVFAGLALEEIVTARLRHAPRPG